VRLPLALALLAGCSETSLSGRGDVDDPEACLEAPAEVAVRPDPECAGEPVIGRFEPIFEWNWSSNPIHPGFHQIMAAPVVGQATDDDGDGDVDADDVPDVLFTAFAGSAYQSPGAIVAISGDDGRTLWSVTEAGGARPQGASGVAIGDLGDGVPTVVVSADRGLLALDARTGAFRWLASVPSSAYGNPALADVDGDGSVEIVYGPSLISADGTVRWTGTAGRGGPVMTSFAVDLDEDGTAEIVAGNTIYEHDGAVRWTAGVDAWPAVGDLDGDGVPEIVTVVNGGVVARNLAGEQVWGFTLTDGRGGPPTIADFDGDGRADVGVASAERYRVIRGDGTLLWENPVQDRSSAQTGSSVFDFEGDGAAEVVYTDEHTLFVWDGATGAEELRWDDHASGTLFEYPLIVDVDGDGSTEIVVASNNYTYAGANGITILGDAEGTWAPARKVWNQHAWHITNSADDGTIPAGAPGNWQRWNSFRAGNSETAVGLALPDLRIGEPEACTLRCETADLAEVWVRVENHGPADAGPFWLAAERDGEAERLALIRAPGLAGGRVTWLGPVPLTEADLATGGVRLTVDASAEVDECDATNNERWIRTWPCIGVAEER
jgi:hypothetical protein